MKRKITSQFNFQMVLILLIFSIMTHYALASPKTFYRWTDEKGVIHVSDDLNKVPAEHQANISKYEKKEKTGLTSKFDEYKRHGFNIFMKFKYYLMGFAAIVLILISSSKIFRTLRNHRNKRNTEIAKNTIISSEIKNMGEDKFKNTVKNVLIKSGYKLKPINSDFNTISNFIALKKRRNNLVHICTDINEVALQKLRDLEIERETYGCNSLMVIANTTFERNAIDYAKKIKCQLVDETVIAKIIVTNGKI